MDGEVSEDWRALQHAEMLLALNRSDEAAAVFRDVISSAPESARALLGLARALTDQGKYREGEGAAKAALALAPDDEQGYQVISDILCALGEGSAALVAAERGMQLAPHSFTSHYQLSRALLAQRRPRTRLAHAAAVRAVHLAPHSADAHNLVGVCLEARGRRRGSRKAFRRALALDPHHPFAQKNLAESEIVRGRLHAAARILRTAVANDPQDFELHQKLDAALLLLGSRIYQSVLVLMVVCGVLLAHHAAWWTRALSAVVAVALSLYFVRRVRDQLPRGVHQWGQGLWGRADWRGKQLIATLPFISAETLILALAPHGHAVASAIVFLGMGIVVGFALMLGLIVSSACIFVRSLRSSS